ncbi:hypothetical protein BKA80DRAFT_286751 [Phyllosticta citrichinensis]
MPVHDFALRLGRSLVPVALLATLYLYLYPLLHGCAFPAPPHSGPAPLRLLALGDPQIEGDTSLPDSKDEPFASLRDFRSHVDELGVLPAARKASVALVNDDIPRLFKGYRKRLDLFGNDYYLAHIYRTLRWWTQPTHVAVLGDLLGSQWISDEEFEWRSWRFWNRVFQHGHRVEDAITGAPLAQELGADSSWSWRVINVAGNHDIGYAGDIDENRIARFERNFGPVNWQTVFRQPKTTPTEESADVPELRVVVLNSMNLDAPAKDGNLQKETYDFINDVISRSSPVESRNHFTLLLTHIPLHKREGVCVDGPFFSYFDNGGGVKEQNHLSPGASRGILEGLFGLSGNEFAPARGMGRNGMIVTGHDHAGCDVYHHHLRGDQWDAVRWESVGNRTADADLPGIREVTLRSMMGEYGGYAGLISIWFDQGRGEWQYEVEMCSLGVQHVWWGVHVLDIVTVSVFAVGIALRKLAKMRKDAPVEPLPPKQSKRD